MGMWAHGVEGSVPPRVSGALGEGDAVIGGTMKLCKDCKHFKDARDWLDRLFGYRKGLFAECRHPLSDRSDVGIEVVDGVHEPRWRPCYAMRDLLGGCGPDAKHFEPKHGGKVHRPEEWPPAPDIKTEIRVRKERQEESRKKDHARKPTKRSAA